MVDIKTINVLKPFANDLVFSPMIIEVDRMPNETSPKIIISPNVVNNIPAPTHIKINTTPSIAKKNNPGVKSLSFWSIPCVNVSVVIVSLFGEVEF